MATGLVVGSMLTSTACKPNQPQDTTSSSTTETTTSTTRIEEPIVKTDEQVENFKKAIRSLFKYVEFEVDMKNNSIIFASRFNEETKSDQYRFVVISNINDRLAYMLMTDISKEEFYAFFNDLSKKGIWNKEELSEKIIPINAIIENCNGESLDMMTEIINKELEIHNQSNKELQK